MEQKVTVTCEFETGHRHATAGKRCQPSSKWVPFSKDTAAKGEGWAPPFFSCTQDTVGL